jgi:hypothetical protein
MRLTPCAQLAENLMTTGLPKLSLEDGSGSSQGAGSHDYEVRSRQHGRVDFLPAVNGGDSFYAAHEGA